MAVKACKDCGGQVSSNAKACPHCGAVAKKGVGILGWLFVLVIVLPVAWGVGTAMNQSTPQTSSAAAPANASASSSAPVALNQKTTWSYGEYKDEMTGKPVKYATLVSTDRALFAFPYNVPGGAQLTLYVRSGERAGEDIFFTIQKGQFLCHRSNCQFNLRVGDLPIQSVKGVPAGAGSSDTLFFASPASMKKILTSGAVFKVELPFYKSGNKTFSFDPAEPLVW